MNNPYNGSGRSEESAYVYNFETAGIDCKAFLTTLKQQHREIAEDYILRQLTVPEIAHLRRMTYSKVQYVLRKALLPLAREFGIRPLTHTRPKGTPKSQKTAPTAREDPPRCKKVCFKRSGANKAK